MSKFITFEGTEGVGKTTQIQLLDKYLKENNIQTLVTREPGGTKVGECIRDILLNKELTQLDLNTELLLMFAARAQHLKEVIYPALEKNIWVLCDRFTDASYAYQGGGRGVEIDQIKKIEQVVHGGFKPNLTILLNCKIEIGMSRVEKRGAKDRFEKEELAFFSRVEKNYLLRAEQEPERFAIINASQEINVVADEIQKTVKQKFDL